MNQFEHAQTPEPPPEEKKPRTMLEGVIRAVMFPIRGKGIWLIIAGAVFFYGINLLNAISPLLSLIFGTFTVAFLACYAFKIVGEAARGEDEAPDWPDATEIGKPLLLYLAALAITVLPAVAVHIAFYSQPPQTESSYTELPSSEDIENPSSAPTQPANPPAPPAALHYPDLAPEAEPPSPPFGLGSWITLGIGMFLLPMILLSLALHDSLAGLNPAVVLLPILRVFPSYLVMVGAFFLGSAICWRASRYINDLVPILGSLTAGAIDLYMIMFQMYLVGLLYRLKERQIGWFYVGP